MDNKSSSQYAFSNNIVLQECFYLDSDEYENIYHTFRNKGKRKVAKKFKNKVHSLSCFPFSFGENTSSTKLKLVLDRNALILGFLNKNISNQTLINYLEIVLNNKYYMINHSLKATDFITRINIGKDKELAEMEFEKRKYVWNEEHKNLKKELKVEIMNKDRFKKVVTENTYKIFYAVTDLIDNYNDFITATIIAQRAGLNVITTSKYIEVYRDEIDSHNKAIYGTSNHNEYLMLLSKEEIKNAVINLRHKDKKINIQTVANFTKLHRNTVAKINKKYKLF